MFCRACARTARGEDLRHLLRSVARCFDCSDGVMIARLHVGPGLTIANYVRTKNLTYPVGSVGHFREEW